MITMFYTLIINRGSTYGHYAPCSYYPQRVHTWSLCSMLLLSTEHMVTILYTLLIHRGSAYGHYAPCSYYPQRVHIWSLCSSYPQRVGIWSLCSILLLSTEGRHIVIMLYTLIINRGSAYDHYALYSYYQQKVRI